MLNYLEFAENFDDDMFQKKLINLDNVEKLYEDNIFKLENIFNTSQQDIIKCNSHFSNLQKEDEKLIQ